MSLVGLVFNVIILMYVLELEKKKCSCSKHWMRDFIKYVSIIMIVLSLIISFIPNFIKSCKTNVLCKSLFGLYGLLGFVYIIILLVYYFHIQKIKNDCPCSLNWKRHALLYPLFGGILVIVFLIIFLIILGVKPFKNLRKNLKKTYGSSKKLSRK
jgi:hypothetical protein